jgi:hypothetical protein
MTIDLYGHLVVAKLWQTARLVGDISGTPEPPGQEDEGADDTKSDERAGSGGFGVEPPIGIEPMTYALRGACFPALVAWPARILQRTTAMALDCTGISWPAVP